MNFDQSTFPLKVDNPLTVKDLINGVAGHSHLYGDTGFNVSSVSSLWQAVDSSLVFCKLSKKEQVQEIVNKLPACVVVSSVEVEISHEQVLIVTDDPLGWFIHALHLLFNFDEAGEIHPSAIIAEDVEIGVGVNISAGVVIEKGSHIGANCRIGQNSVIGSGTFLDEGVFIQHNVSIGGVGLGYHHDHENNRMFFPHLGVVRIGKGVVIGSGSVIVKGQLEDTVIGDNTRLGNLVNVGHNVSIGKNCAISSNTCIAGGVAVLNHCNIAASVVINAKITIGNNCQVGLGSVVTKTLPDNESVFGNPAKRLPTMRRF